MIMDNNEHIRLHLTANTVVQQYLQEPALRRLLEIRQVFAKQILDCPSENRSDGERTKLKHLQDRLKDAELEIMKFLDLTFDPIKEPQRD